MFPIELSIFVLATYVFGRSKNAVHINSTRKFPVMYFPVAALAFLIGNNLIQIVLFTSTNL